MEDFKIRFLDHVAIMVKDLNVSAQWYHEVFGLEKYQLEKWGEYPIFMMSGKSGIALFPANTNDPKFDPSSNNVKIDHFAFNVSGADFELALLKFEHLGIPYEVKDHHYFKSVYEFEMMVKVFNGLQ